MITVTTALHLFPIVSEQSTIQLVQNQISSQRIFARNAETVHNWEWLLNFLFENSTAEKFLSKSDMFIT